MSKSKRASRKAVLKKLRHLRERWAGHEGADTPYGHILVGPSENGRAPAKVSSINKVARVKGDSPSGPHG
jgi:hypothetical protein